MDALFPLVMVGLVLVFLGLSVYLSRRRTQALKDLAANWGFEFCGAGNDLVDASVWGFQCTRTSTACTKASANFPVCEG
ncbi:MAG: hypothetical protein O3C67_01210 [Cyanobacteria bacterium]|nr:hypothetical protein [Cyanobacteriota bacterium]MEB3268600.1 hypothetical protein [Leptolyngbya sp.]